MHTLMVSVSKTQKNGFAMFHGGDVQNVEGTPSNEETPDYQKLVDQYNKLSVPNESAGWGDKKQCQYTPPNPDFKKDEWFSTCDSTFRKVDSREGAICNNEGTLCDVFTPDVIGIPETELCDGNTAFKLKEDKNVDDSSSSGGGSSNNKKKIDQTTKNVTVWIVVGVFGGVIVLMFIMLCLRNTCDKTKGAKTSDFVELPHMNLPPIPDSKHD